MRFTDQLRESVNEQWDTIVNHRFTTEIAKGSIHPKVLKKYLVQDHRFLDSFVVLLATIVANVRELSDRIPGCQFLALITGKENTYFERSLQKLGYDAEKESIPSAPCTLAFCNLMRSVAKTGTLGEMLAVIVVCEWSYLCWGERVLPFTKRENFECYEWVDLHSGIGFESVVEYLRGLLDKEEAFLSEPEKFAVKARFQEAVQCEEDFFNFAYSNDD